MRKATQSLIKNQFKRKTSFLTKPIKTFNKSPYFKKVMTYAHYYEKNNVNPSHILYQVTDGKSMTDSPYAIFLYLTRHKAYQHLHHTWVVDSESTAQHYRNQFQHLSHVSFVIKESKSYLKALTTCKYLINNATFPAYFTKKENQVYINTWHGTPLKHMGLDIPHSLIKTQNTMRNFLISDYIISPNKHTTTILDHAFKLSPIYQGNFLEIGYPRLDLTINSTEADIRKVLSSFIHLNQEKIILYCPTWQGTDVNKPIIKEDNIYNEIKALESITGYQVLLKVHPFVYKKIAHSDNLKPYLIPNTFDTNQLLSVVDLIITDYSSIFFDFLVTDKPIIFYTTNHDEYARTRGLYIDTQQLPGPIYTNINDVIQGIQNETYKQYDKNYQQFKAQFCSHDDGNACQRLIKAIFSTTLKTTPSHANSEKQKTKLLFYPGGLKNNGITTSMLKLLENIDYEKYDVTLMVTNSKNIEFKNNLNQINGNVRVLFRSSPFLTSFKDLYRVEFIRQRGVYHHFEEVIHPKHLYRREMRKVFGDIQFDYAIDFSGYAFFWGNLVLAANAKKKYIYMHSDMQDDQNRTVNGKRPHYQNLKTLFSIYKRFDKLISVSEATMKVNQRKFSSTVPKNKFNVCRNTINYSKIKRLINDDSEIYNKDGKQVIVSYSDGNLFNTPFDQSHFNIVFIGRLSPEKGIDLLIKAVHELKTKHPHIRLYILGDGPLKETFVNMITHLNLEHNVFLLGHQRNPFYLLKRANLFALTSHYEGQSMVILEALSTGTPVLASDIIANRYVLEDGKYGMLVKNEIQHIANGIETFIKGTQPSYSRFDVESYNKAVMDEFYSLLD
ncbi:glycosyltransferase [Staphylococcus warneri]|uniref:glycosyltransferase n=1 Tax=Staphylococcus warneri TaxID=1292 RepID=UPI00301D7B03